MREFKGPQGRSTVYYDDQLIGTLIPDLIIDDLVLNFKNARSEWKRVARGTKLKAYTPEARKDFMVTVIYWYNEDERIEPY